MARSAIATRRSWRAGPGRSAQISAAAERSDRPRADPRGLASVTASPRATWRHDVTDLGYRAFDADNHYYEAIDAFTRHLDPRLGPRTVQWAEIGGRKYHVVGGRVSRAVANPTFDPIARPGALHAYFR